MPFTYGRGRLKPTQTMVLSPTRHGQTTCSTLERSQDHKILNKSQIKIDHNNRSGLSLFGDISPRNTKRLCTTLFKESLEVTSESDDEDDEPNMSRDINLTVTTVEQSSPTRNTIQVDAMVEMESIRASRRTYGVTRSFREGDEDMGEPEELDADDEERPKDQLKSSLDLHLSGMNNRFREELELAHEDYSMEKHVHNRCEVLNELCKRINTSDKFRRFVSANGLGKSFLPEVVKQDGQNLSCMLPLLEAHLTILKENPCPATLSFHTAIQPIFATFLQSPIIIDYLSQSEPVSQENVSVAAEAIIKYFHEAPIDSIGAFKTLAIKYPDNKSLEDPAKLIVGVLEDESTNASVVSAILALGVQLTTESSPLQYIFANEDLMETLFKMAEPGLLGKGTEFKQSLFALGFLVNLTELHKPDVAQLKRLLDKSVFCTDNLDRIHCAGYFCLICSKHFTDYNVAKLTKGLETFAKSISSNETIRNEVDIALNKLSTL